MEAHSTYDDEACDEGVDGNGGNFGRMKKSERVSVPHQTTKKATGTISPAVRARFYGRRRAATRVTK